MKIYTYYHPVPELNMIDEMKLLLLWRENWKAHGFEPEVLTEWDAQRHPYYPEYNEKISAFPTINPKAYELACFRRWLAMAQVGGGIMADFDVLNRNQPVPQSLPEGLTIYQVGANGVWVPCLVSGSRDDYMEMCEQFAAYTLQESDREGSRPHTSDQNAIQHIRTTPAGQRLIKAQPLVVGYSEPGWEKAKVCHFSNGNCTPMGRTPRWAHVEELIK